MFSNIQSLSFSPFITIYDMVVPKYNMLRQINELVDFSFVLEELKQKYCLDNSRNALPLIRMTHVQILLIEIYYRKEIYLTHIAAVKEKLNVQKEVVEDYLEQIHFSTDLED